MSSGRHSEVYDFTLLKLTRSWKNFRYRASLTTTRHCLSTCSIWAGKPATLGSRKMERRSVSAQPWTCSSCCAGACLIISNSIVRTLLEQHFGVKILQLDSIGPLPRCQSKNLGKNLGSGAALRRKASSSTLQSRARGLVCAEALCTMSKLRDINDPRLSKNARKVIRAALTHFAEHHDVELSGVIEPYVY